jgi:flagellar motor switch protein FliN
MSEERGSSPDPGIPQGRKAQIRPLDYPDLAQSMGDIRQPLDVTVEGGALEALLQVPLEVQVVLGTAYPTLAELAQLQPGDVVVLDSVAGDPVVLEVAGVPFARAEVVVFDDQYAVRIVELLDDPAALVGRHSSPPIQAAD